MAGTARAPAAGIRRSVRGAPRRCARMFGATRSAPLATTSGARMRFSLVPQRHREVRRVHDHDVRLRDLVHHAAPRQLAAASADAVLGFRGAVVLLVLVAQLLRASCAGCLSTDTAAAARRPWRSGRAGPASHTKALSDQGGRRGHGRVAAAMRPSASSSANSQQHSCAHAPRPAEFEQRLAELDEPAQPRTARQACDRVQAVEVRARAPAG